MIFTTGKRSAIPYILSFLMFVGLIGCGGGESAPPPPDTNPTGYYTGSASVKEANNTTTLDITDIQVMVDNNRIMAMSDSQAVLYDGSISVTGNEFTATVNIYKNGIKETSTATINGSITEGTQITGTLTGTGLGNGTFVVTYSALNNTSSTLTSIETGTNGTHTWGCKLNDSTFYTGLDVSPSGLVSTVINNDNSLFAGCTISGMISPKAGAALFNVTITSITSCTNSDVNHNNSGVYSGLAVVKTVVDPNDVFPLTISNGTYSTNDDCILLFKE